MKILVIVLIFILPNLLLSKPGDLLWRYKCTDKFYTSSPIADNEKVYFANESLYAFTKKGDFKWSYRMTARSFNTPCMDENIIIYVSLIGNTVYACSTSSGKERWKKTISTDPYGKIETLLPIIGNGICFFTTQNAYVFGLDIPNGNTVLCSKIDGAFPLKSPVFSQNKIYVPDSSYPNNCSIYCINATNGSQIWKYTTDTYLQYELLVVNNMVYIGGYNSYAYALNAETGQLIWKVFASYASRFADSKPCYSNGIVYFPGMKSEIDTGHLFAFNAANGEKIWERLDGEFTRIKFPAIDNEAIYLGGESYIYTNQVYAINKVNGQTMWTFWHDGNLIYQSSPCASDGIVFIGNNDNYLYAIETYGYTGFKDNKSASYLPAKSLSVSPNPFSSRLSLSLPSSGAVYSLTGQLVMNLSKGKLSVDTSKWREGVYIVKSGMECKRIVKIR
ncbi:MAG: PQQ-like beta-propeller repeat protein [Candidatus Coatesbacteria bacterium]|nr:PQQ-like beta-propeller repeat protein [Candidatus Coatesbacteria bacterium]